MSLRYVIDGYNLINNSFFIHNALRGFSDAKLALCNFIKSRKLSGVYRNPVVIVFDGYPESGMKYGSPSIKVIFSRMISADERIRKILETASTPKNMIVVSDDKEIKSFARLFGAKALKVEDFLDAKNNSTIFKREIPETEISYTAMHKINAELRKIWLQE